MADFNEFKMDLKIDDVKPSDEGEYVCLYRGAKMVHEKHIFLRVLSKFSFYGTSRSCYLFLFILLPLNFTMTISFIISSKKEN